MNEFILNSNTHDGLLSAAEGEWAVPCRDVARWVSVARPNSGKREAAKSRVGMQALQPRQGLMEDFVYLFTFPNKSNALEFW
jgi:hypothetical protein